MGGDQAAKTLLQIQVASMKAKGETISPEEEERLLNVIRDRYEKQTTPYYAAARLWVDAIIDPAKTRKYISEAIAATNHQPSMGDFKTGVFQV
jgi:acetyl-CoA carboxylase carboxyltransferase component